ncbi:MAG: DMT family transporter [Gammaproteobacteria bacterium]|nr:DMT family transporter [Gammaproteobacteria bacterium]
MTENVIKDKVAGNVGLMVSTSIWATMFPVTESLLQTWDPIAITAGRLTGGAIILLTALALTGNFGRAITNVPWGKLILLGIVGVSISTLALAYGIKHSGAVESALIATTSPILATLLVYLFYSEPLRKGIVGGVLLAVAGGICTVFADGQGLEGFQGGELFILAALSMWIWYSYNCQRWLRGIPQLGIAALTVAAGALVLDIWIALAELMKLTNVSFDTSSNQLILVGYLALGPASFSLFLWHFGVSRIGITVASMYGNLVPIVVVLIAVAFGRYPTVLHLIGGALIISGVLYAQLRNLKGAAV